MAYRSGRKMTWGDRLIAKRNQRKAMRPTPEEYFARQHTHYSQVNNSMLKTEEGLAQTNTYYMNVPEDSRFKSYLHELGKYANPMTEGTYNQHENLQEGTADMMVRRVAHGMS